MQQTVQVHTYALVFAIQFSQAKPVSHITFWTMELPWGQVELCKNLLFLFPLSKTTGEHAFQLQ